MAKQVGEIKMVGTIDDITFYKMEGEYYARKKSRLTGKRVKRDPRFARTMESAHRLGRGSQLASKVYRSLPRTGQAYTLYKKLKSLAVLALKEGAGEAAVLQLLQAVVLPSTNAVVPCGDCKKEGRAKFRSLFISLPSLICLPKGRVVHKLRCYTRQLPQKPRRPGVALPATPVVDST